MFKEADIKEVYVFDVGNSSQLGSCLCVSLKRLHRHH